MTPSRLRHRIGTVIADRGLWPRGARVGVAVSGGLDSVCLLDLLVETESWHGGALQVVTVDHGTRPGSASDATFVQTLATQLGLSCQRLDLAIGPAPEERLRQARYDAFATLDVDHIALGHHADDRVETVLLHLMRGTGTRGFAGMAWRRGRFVRPLLGVRRAQLRGWADHRGLAWVEDPSNTDPAFLRNRVRHELVPRIEALRPGSVAAMARSASHAAADDAFLDDLAADVDPAQLANTPEPLARRWVLAKLPVRTAAHVDAVLAAVRRGSGRVELPDGWAVVVVDGLPSPVRSDGNPR